VTEICKDCKAEGITTKRPLALGAPGPRCVTHWRAEKKRRRGLAHARMVQKVYDITPEQYAALYAYQGGHCAICEVATGKVRRLAVDHDHKTGEVRGLLCGPCNKDVVGRLGIEALRRAIKYLEDPPGKILARPKVYE
jgi:Recombination endonuclease VII